MMKTKLLLVLLVAVGLMASTAQANLLKNPSFEDGAFETNDTPDFWTHYWTSYAPTHVWISDADGAHSGSKYMQVKMWTTGSYGWLLQTVDVTPDLEYAFSVWAKSATEGEQIEIWGYYDWLDAGGAYIGGGWLSYSDWVEDDWEYADLGKRTAPATATQAIFWLCGDSAYGLQGAFFDDAYMDIPRPRIPTPTNGTLVLIGDVDLSWTNLDPNDPEGSVYVEVLFGTEPNETHPVYNMEPLTLDPVSGQDVTSATASAPVEGTYYWQVNSYIYGDPATTSYDTNPNDPNIIKGEVWSFTAVSDLPPSVTINTPDMIAWQNEPVQLDATVVDEGNSPVLIEWTASATGVTFEPDAFVEDPVISIASGLYTNANILNPSFELRLAYWDQIGVGHGAWSGTGLDKFINPSDGILLAYTDSASNDGADAGLSQTLIETLAVDTTYTLTVDVANDGYYDEDVDYRVQLRAGEGILAEDNNEQHELPIPGGSVKPDWYTSTVVYTLGDASDPNFAYIGEPLEIRLLAINGTQEMSFDNVHLTADPGFPVPPGYIYELTFTATDDAGSDSDTVEIDLYDDACEAARIGFSLGTANRGDIVGHSDSRPDCVTDIYDLAEMALRWLLDTSPTEAFDNPKQPPANPVVNGIFNAYKPGSETITAEFIYDSFTRGVGEDLPVLNSGIVIYSDGTSGGVVDCPGWVLVEGTTPPDLLNNGVGSSVGFNAFGTWSNGEGTRAVSDRPVGTISGGKIYTISAVVSGSAGPLVLELQADDVLLAPSSSVTPAPSDLGDWQEISRTYDANAVTDHVGKPMKIVIGTTPPDLFGTRVVFDNVELETVSSDPIFPSVYAGPDMIAWSGLEVQLAPTVINNDPDEPQGTLSYEWSTSDPNTVFSDPNIEAPTVTITKEPAEPSIVLFVVNAGFEDPPYDDGDFAYSLPKPWRDGYYWPSRADGGLDGDWYDDDYYAGIENPAADYAYGGIVPEGENAAFQYSYYDAEWGGYDMGLRQVLAATLEPDTHYELSVMVGNPDAVASSDYLVELLAGGDLLNSTTGASPDPNMWTATPVTVTYDSPSTVDAGQALEIRLVLVDDGSTDQLLHFDDVQLLINGESGAIVYSYLPAVVSLTLGVTLEGYVTVFDTMAIDVYDTPCLAIIETYPDVLDPTDITADDCITNLVDFAVMAKTWLDDYTLTAPAPKP